MWMDHRAKEETEAVNKVEHPVKSFVGGKISVEMQVQGFFPLRYEAVH